MASVEIDPAKVRAHPSRGINNHRLALIKHDD